MNGSVMNVVCFEWSVMNGLFWTGLFWTDTIFFIIQVFEQLALALKNRSAHKIFTVLKYFLPISIFEQLALALKTEFALKFFKTGGRPPSPTPRLIRLWVHLSPQLTQRFVSWSIPVVPRVWIKTQRRVEKGQKMGLARAIQTCDVYFQRYHCLSVSACSVGTWEKSRLLTLQTNLAACCQKSLIQSLFYHTLFEAWVIRGVLQTQSWVMLKNVWELSGWSLSLNPLVFKWQNPID